MSFKTMDDGQVLLYAVRLVTGFLVIVDVKHIFNC